MLDENKIIRVLFLDYQKAFDHVDHNILFHKLKQLELPDFLLNWINSYLNNRKQRVKLSNVLSEWRKLNGAVPKVQFLARYSF